jgi:hypothetical protein
MGKLRIFPALAPILAGVMLAATPRVTLAGSPPESINLRGVTLRLGRHRDAVLKDLQGLSLRQQGSDDYFNVYSTPDPPTWIGSVQFEHKKLALVIKSWAGADDKTMKGVIRDIMGSNRSCGFAVAWVPSPGSQLKLTTLACPKRQVVMQVNDDQAAGIVKCNVEVLGDPGNRLKEVDFWKSCR